MNFLLAPTLEIGAATDPQGDTLTYTVEIYDDVAMTTRVQTLDDIPEVGAGATAVPAPLVENTPYAWRARAEHPILTH